MQVSLTSERLLMRPIAEPDVALLHRHWTDENVRRYLSDRRVIEHAMAEAFVASSLESAPCRDYGLWVLEDRNRARFLGVRDGELDGPELLYSIEPACGGQGLATESARRVLAHGFDDLGLGRVQATVDAPNGASVRVLEKLGFRRTREAALDSSTLLYCELESGGFER
jgi:ribosomal-protein-alanine N-acetyltransferase